MDMTFVCIYSGIFGIFVVNALLGLTRVLGGVVDFELSVIGATSFGGKTSALLLGVA